MFCVYFLQLIFILLINNVLCVTAYFAGDIPLQKKAIDDFLKTNTIQVTKIDGGKEQKEDITIKSINNAFLVATNNVMVALADVTKNGSENDENIVLAKYIETKESDNWGDRAIEQGESEWNTQLATEKTTKQKPQDSTAIKSHAVATKDNKVYFITISNTPFEEPQETPTADKWHIRLLVGEFPAKRKGEKIFDWSNKTYFKIEDSSNLEKKLNIKPPTNLLSNGFAFVTGDKINIIYVVKSETADSKNNNNFVIFLQLEDNKTKINLLDFENMKSCYPYFLQWEEEIIMILTSCSNSDSYNVKVIKEGETRLSDSDKPIARLRDFLKNKNNFATAVIETTEVLLFTQLKTIENKKKVIHLWVSDGTRVARVGIIDINIKDLFVASIVHTNSELFALHKKNNNEEETSEENTYSLTRLKEHLKNITNIVEAWNTNKAEIAKLCTTTDKMETSCSTVGPVGFLRGGEGDKWKDEYRNVNATVTITNGEKTKITTDGFTFSGAGGAQWPVGNPSEERPYNFTDPGFTLIATVKIDSDVNSNLYNSVLGVYVKKETGGSATKRFGLWCNSNKKWAVSFEENTPSKESNEMCEKEKTYITAIVLNKDNSLKIYIDGKPLTGLSEVIKIEKNENITDIYFGVDNKEENKETVESHVTITNVLLYNKPLIDSEIEKFKATNNNNNLPSLPKQDESEAVQQNNDEHDLYKAEKSTNENEQFSDASDQSTISTKENNENVSSRLSESAVRINDGISVFCVLFILSLSEWWYYLK